MHAWCPKWNLSRTILRPWEGGQEEIKHVSIMSGSISSPIPLPWTTNNEAMWGKSGNSQTFLQPGSKSAPLLPATTHEAMWGWSRKHFWYYAKRHPTLFGKLPHSLQWRKRIRMYMPLCEGIILVHWNEWCQLLIMTKVLWTGFQLGSHYISVSPDLGSPG